MSYRLGIDVGGTFTDFILLDEDGAVSVTKAPSTPSRPADGVFDGLAKLAEEHGFGADTDDPLQTFVSQIDLIVHGTTITTNAVITGEYSKTGYLTTEGFRHLLNERRGVKRNAFTAKEAPPEPIVPTHLIQVASERVDRDGDVIEPLDEDDVREAAQRFVDLDVEAVAVNFLFSFLNPTHEQRAKEILQEELDDAYVSISSDVLPQIRVYERGSTTVFNACLGPLLRTYITDLQERLSDTGFAGTLLLMQSNGGVMSPDVARDFAANTLLSGPASGPIAGVHFASEHGLNDLITVDMGGTSLDCCLVVGGEPETTTEQEIAEYALALPSLEIETIGSGGGSIAWVDSGGILHVGPQSAGAEPGPASYGLGGEEPTITDANLVLGYLNPGYFLGGERDLDIERARTAITKHVAEPMGLALEEAAAGIIEIANTNMANGVRHVSVSRGVDPRDFVLVMAGGAGPLHACGIADELGIQLIFIPQSSSVFCASGMLISDLRHDAVSFLHMRLDEERADLDAINELRDESISRIGNLLDAEGVDPDRRRFDFAFDLKYEGQFNELSTEVPMLSDRHLSDDDLPRIQRRFDEQHDAVYGYNLPGSLLELMSVRTTAIGVTDKPDFQRTTLDDPDPSRAAKAQRKMWFEGSPKTVQTYEGARLRAGNEIDGPAVIEEATTTIRVDAGWQLRVDALGDYLIWRSERSLEELLQQFSGEQAHRHPAAVDIGEEEGQA